jgi:hypothetical protein
MFDLLIDLMVTINATRSAYTRTEKLHRLNEALTAVHALNLRLLKFKHEVEDGIVGPEIEL